MSRSSRPRGPARLRRALAGAIVALAVLAPPALALTPAHISTSFGAASIPLNGSTSLSFGIGNPNMGSGLTSLAFTDYLPAGLVVATPNGASDDCGGTLTATAGSSSVSLSGGTVGPGALCGVSVNVTGTANGKKENSVTVSSSPGTGNTSTATLQVGTLTPGPRAYWSNLSGSIAFANLNGGGGGDIDTAGATITSNGGSLEPDGVAIDLARGRVYWTTYLGNTISYANLDGSGGGGDLNTAGATVDHPNGLVVDQADGRIYWANQTISSGPGSIEFAKLDGSGGGGRLNITGVNVGEPTGLAIDPAARRVYWSKTGDPNGNILAYANLDTGAGHDLVTTGLTSGFPHEVAAPPAATKLYVAGDFALSFVNLDDSGAGGFTTTGAPVNSPWGVGIDLAAGRVYWTNSGSLNSGTTGANTIGFANLDNSGGGGGLDTTGATVSEPDFLALVEVPAPAGAPAVAGGSTPGSLLSCSQGAWGTDVPSAQLYRALASLAYSWSVNGQPIPGASASTYTAPADGGYRCTVTATNVAGSSAQTSAVHTVATPASTAGGLPGSPLGSGLPPVFGSARPALSALGETNSVFAVGPASTPLTGRTAAARHKRGTVFSFRLDRAATVKIAIQTKARGRRVGRVCKPDSRRLRAKPRCTRTVTLATLTRTAHAGVNTVAFSGRISGKALRPGRYQAAFTAADAAGSSPAKALGFTIVKR